jgi:hypothetical protein
MKPTRAKKHRQNKGEKPQQGSPLLFPLKKNKGEKEVGKGRAIKN